MIISKEKQAELISLAIEAIQAVGIAGGDGRVQKVNEGYINALGPAIIQSGLLPTLIFYNKGGDQEESNAEGDLSLWLKALLYMHQPEGRNKIRQKKGHECIAELLDRRSGTLKDLSQEEPIKRLRGEVLQYVVALKLALRTFEIDDPKKKGGKV